MSEKHAPARPEKPAGLVFFEAQEHMAARAIAKAAYLKYPFIWFV